MFRTFLLLILVLAAGPVTSCTSDDGSNPGMDVSGSEWDDIPAMEINAFNPVEKSYCVGRARDESFAQYDYQCEDAYGRGECVQMPNPHLGKAFYCALCGLKGTKMVCFLINPENE